ncbi:MAG: glycosyltransferase [Bacteroidaceae bacterium]|nr:glycosyltransferase [Bacteroidaceae bacterium]
MEPLISFIITYHNEPEEYLQACLESIMALRLTADEAEILLVDDGSDVPPTFAGRAGIEYYRQEQAGLSVARNTGIKHSKGQYLQFVDADDYLFPSVYEAVLERIRAEQPDIVMFRMTENPIYKPSAEPIRVKVKFPVKGAPPKGSRGGGYFLQHRNLRAAAWGYAFRREILGDLRFYPGILHEDELFTPQLFLRAETLLELDAKVYFYRQHDGTITHSDSLLMVHKRLDDISFIIRELRTLGKPLLERRIRQLTLDYLQKTWTLTHSLRELRRRARELKKEGFLPLPIRCYSPRYFLASLLV